MRILIDTGHPAHVHFFRNAIRELERRGHEVKITARDKDVTLHLLDYYKFKYTVRPSGWRPLNLFSASKFIGKLGKDVDVFVGVHNPYVAMAAQRLGKRCVLFTDTPGSGMANRFSVGRATTVCTPDCLAGMFSNQVTYPGYKEMAYLHPRVFRPEPNVLAENGLGPGEKYYMVRFIKWNAYHDRGRKGMSAEEKKELVKALAGKGKVLVCPEGNEAIPEPGVRILKPEHVHSLLFYASGYVGEGATTAKEAAVLGAASIEK